MFSTSVIDSVIVQAYLETEYHVFCEPAFCLKVGQASAELLSAHKNHGVDCSAFLTACNPFSQSLEEETNRARQTALAKELDLRSLEFRPGVGKHQSNGWPAEDSFLVFGLTREAAKTLGVRLEQNAIIWNGADAVPELILLR